MKQEDKKFLADLAKELNTQDNDGTANPIWCIMDKETVVVPEGCGDFKVVTYDERTLPLEVFVEQMAERVPEALVTEFKYVLSTCIDTEELRDILAEYTGTDVSVYNLYEARKEDCICRDATGFLTKKSAEEHLKQNAHHYTKEARAYALSAWRNPVFERLINIIKNTNWEEI